MCRPRSTYQQPQESVGGGAMWVGRTVGAMDGAIEPPWTGLRRVLPTHTAPPSQQKASAAVAFDVAVALGPRRVQGAALPTKNPACAGFSVYCVQQMLTDGAPGPRRPWPWAAGPAWSRAGH